MIVLDASALLVLIQDEPGAGPVADAIGSGAVMSTVNLAEVIGKLTDAGLDAGRVRSLVAAAGVVVEPLSAADAELAGALRAVSGGRGLSLGDRCCLALTSRTPPHVTLTADRAWAELDLPLTVRLLR